MIALPTAEAVLQRSLGERAFSAVSAEVGNAHGALWTFAAGQLAFDDPTAVDRTTIFDLASLTKVLATASIALQLMRRGVLDVAVPTATVLREWSPADRSIVTLGDLLEHSSGLPAYRNYFRRISGLESYVTAISTEPLEYTPRTRSVYSDLGFIVLGAALEHLGRAPLAHQFTTWKATAGITEPLVFLPPAAWKSRSAVTEHDPWRGRLLRGEVHDENAAALGGVAAHAGLFGTAKAVGDAARWWMRQLATPEGRRFAQRSSVAGSSRALGWDTMRPTSSCGHLMSPQAIGHTGFTGTTLWIDPARERYFVLLTNRVHVTRTSDIIQRVRRAFHDAANQDLA